MLKGKTNSVATFEPICESRDEVDNKAAYEAAFQSLSQEDPTARHLFAQLARLWPDDSLIKLYTRRLDQGRTGEVMTVS